MRQVNDEYISKHDIVKRYLQNKLTPEETVEFEEYMIDKPELLEQLEVDSVFIETLPLADEKQSTLLSDMKRFWYTPILACAATWMAVSLLPALQFSTDTNTPHSAIDQIVYIETVRASETPIYDITTSANRDIVFFMLPDPNQSGPFEVETLHLDSSTNITKGLTVPRSNTGDVVFSLAAEQLPVGEYKITMTDQLSGSQTTASVMLSQSGK